MKHLNAAKLIQEFQSAIGYNDLRMCEFLGTGLSVFREGKAGTQDLPTYAMAIILEQLDLIYVSNTTCLQDIFIVLLTKSSRGKYLETKRRHVISNEELVSIKKLSSKYKTSVAQSS